MEVGTLGEGTQGDRDEINNEKRKKSTKREGEKARGRVGKRSYVYFKVKEIKESRETIRNLRICLVFKSKECKVLR